MIPGQSAEALDAGFFIELFGKGSFHAGVHEFLARPMARVDPRTFPGQGLWLLLQVCQGALLC
jgi:hypothetical protein